jgi:hypothetical protein
MADYMMMSSEELSLNTFIKENENGKYIKLKGDSATELETLDLHTFLEAIVPKRCYSLMGRY